MKKLLFTGLLGLGLLLPTNFSASTTSSSSTKELLTKKPRKGKTKKSSRSKSTRSNYSSSGSYSKNRGCTYNGNQLYVGPRGGCYYYSGNSKQYVDKSYCSGCN